MLLMMPFSSCSLYLPSYRLTYLPLNPNPHSQPTIPYLRNNNNPPPPKCRTKVSPLLSTTHPSCPYCHYPTLPYTLHPTPYTLHTHTHTLTHSLTHSHTTTTTSPLLLTTPKLPRASLLAMASFGPLTLCSHTDIHDSFLN